MKRSLGAFAICAVVIGVTASSCNSGSAPTNQQECISQGYEWEVDQNGESCDTDEDGGSSSGFKKSKKKKRTSAGSTVHQNPPAYKAPPRQAPPRPPARRT